MPSSVIKQNGDVTNKNGGEWRYNGDIKYGGPPVSSIVAKKNSPHWRFIGKIIEEMASTQAVDDF